MKIFKFTHSFFYNLEGAAIYAEAKIWRKYTTSTWGHHIIETTSFVLIMTFLFLVDLIIGWPSFYWIIGFFLFLIMPVFSYYSDRRYNKKGDNEILSDFNKLSKLTRYLYLAYVLGFCVLLPIALILVFVLYKLLL